MSKAQKVVWTKGMFLMPQHFQAQDEYFEQALHFRAEVSSFANWGFSRLSFDEASLVNGLFTLRHAEGLFPDGMGFQAPLADELPPGRQLEALFSPSARTLDVFLAVAEMRPSARNYTLNGTTSNGTGGSGQAAAATRYRVETQAAIDASLGSDEKNIQVARKSLRLFFEGENTDGFTVLRLAQVTRSPAGTFILNAAFVPPLLDILASDALMQLARRQVEVLTAKSASLSAPRRQQGRDLADFTTGEIASFWLLHTVNSSLPELKHLWKSRRGHPDLLFRTLLRLAGALTTFALNKSVRDLPDYDHNALGPCFSELDLFLRDLLETVLPSKCLATPLHLQERLLWAGSLPDERQLDASQFLLSINSPMAVDELIAKFPRLAKISGPDEMSRLIRNSLPGVTLLHVPTPPASVPMQLNNQYFRLVQTEALWDGVLHARTINVFVPGEILTPRMELLTILA